MLARECYYIVYLVILSRFPIGSIGIGGPGAEIKPWRHGVQPLRRCAADHRKGAGNSLTASLIGIGDIPDRVLVQELPLWYPPEQRNRETECRSNNFYGPHVESVPHGSPPNLREAHPVKPKPKLATLALTNHKDWCKDPIETINKHNKGSPKHQELSKSVKQFLQY